MPVLDFDPGTSPEAPGTLRFYKQGSDPDSGFVATTEGGISLPGDTELGDTMVEGLLTVDGFLETESGQSNGQWSIWTGTRDALRIGTEGGGLAVAEGTNARSGVATLVAGTVVVPNTSVTANTRIQLTAQTSGAAPGALRVSARTPATSFTISSTSGTDTSVVAYFMVEPSA